MLYMVGLYFLCMLLTLAFRGADIGLYLLGPFAIVTVFVIVAHIRWLDKMVGRKKNRLGIIVYFSVLYMSMGQLSSTYPLGDPLEISFSLIIGLYAYLTVDNTSAYLSTVSNGNIFLGANQDAKKVMIRFPPQEESDYSFYVFLFYMTSLAPWLVKFYWQAKKMFVIGVL